jgi:uncharacterized protein
MRPVLLLPGIGDSGPSHWQSLWQAKYADVNRIMQRDWDHPVCDEWVACLDQAVRGAAAPPILVAHSLGCLAVVHWAARPNRCTDRHCHAMLLVAVPDPRAAAFPRDATGFAPLPGTLLECPPTVISSSDDPYSSTEFTEKCVAAWNAEHVALRQCGHINADSGLGDWPEGWDIVDRWRHG